LLLQQVLKEIHQFNIPDNWTWSRLANVFLKITDWNTSLSPKLCPGRLQIHFVAKVDELMALCDRYEAAKQTRDKLQEALAASAISHLAI
jgi:hypothetical protein